MGRRTVQTQTKDLSSKRPPIWRGIGCLLMIIIPVVSYAASVMTMPYLRGLGLIPVDLLFTPQLPSWIWAAPVLARMFQFLFVRYGIFATLLLTSIYIVLIGGTISVLYAFMYRLTAPARYGPLDAPPPKRKIKKYTR